MADSVKIKITGDSAPFEKELGGLGKKAGSVFKGMMASQIVTKGFSAMVNSLKSAVNTAMDFESSMSRVQALSGATEEEFRKLTETAKAYGASTVFTASQAAEALQYMALAGWDAQQSMDALGGVLDLAAASGMDLAAASDAVTDYLSAFGMQASQAGYMADLMAYAQSKSNTSAAQLADAYGNCASSMHAAGQDIETTTAMLMALANQGIKGSEAGTQMSAVMRDLTSKMQNGKIMIGNTAVTVQDAQGNFRDLNDIIADVAKATEGLGTAEASAALMDTFTARSVKAIQTLLNEGVENVNAYEDALRGSEGTAAEQSAVMLDNLQGDIKLFQSALEGLQITAGEAFNGIAREITQEATGLLDALNAAGKRGGLEGMFDELINQLPGILDRVTDFVGQAVDKLAKKLPALLKKVFGQLPKMIGKLLDLAPALIENVLSALGEVVEAVIANLPELLGRIIQALPGILMGLLKGIGNIFTGLFDGIVKALKNAGIIRKSAEDLVAEQIANADLSGYTVDVDDVEIGSVGLSGGEISEEDIEAYRTKLTNAMDQIRAIIGETGLNETEQTELEKAILAGSGADAFRIAVQSLGFTEDEAKALTDRLEAARNTLETAYAKWSLDPETMQKVWDYMNTARTIEEALQVVMNMSPEEAAEAAKTVQPYLDQITNTLREAGLDNTTIMGVLRFMVAEHTISNALSDLTDLDDETIASVAAQLDPIVSSINTAIDSMGLTPEQKQAVLDYVASGHSMEEALTTIAGMPADQAKAKGAPIDEALGKIDEVLTAAGLDPIVIQKVKRYVTAGNSLEEALEIVAGMTPDDAKTTAEQAGGAVDAFNEALDKLHISPAKWLEILAFMAQGHTLEEALQEIAEMDPETAQAAAADLQPALDEIAAIYSTLDLKDVSLEDFTNACLAAHGDMVAALKMLGITDPEIATMLASAGLLKLSIVPTLTGLFDELKKVFTDGISSNDAEGMEKGIEGVNSAFDEAEANVNAWAEQAKKDLEAMGLSVTDMKTQMDAIDQEATNAKNQLDATRQQAIDWINTYGSAATEVVKAHIDELDGIIAQVTDIEARIDYLRNNMDVGEFNLRSAVERGAVSNKDLQAKAVALTIKEKQLAYEEAARNYANALAEQEQIIQEAEAEYNRVIHSEGVTDKQVNAAEAKLRETEEAATQAMTDAEAALHQAEADADANAQAHMDAILEGSMRATGAIDEEAEAVRNLVGNTEELPEAEQAAYESGIGLVEALLEGMKSGETQELDADQKAILTELTGYVNDDLITRFEDDLANKDTAALDAYLRAWREHVGQSYETAIEEGFTDLDTSQVTDLMAYAIANGFTFDSLSPEIAEAVENEDYTALAGYLLDLWHDAVMEEVSGTESEPLPASVVIEPEPEVSDDGAVEETVEEATEQALDTAPATVEPTVKVMPKPELVADGVAESEVAQAYETSLNQAAGEAELTEEAAPDTGSVQGIMSSGGKSVGKSFSEGLASGIRSGQSAAIQAAIDVARAAINAAKETLDSHSPSRVTAELGRMFDKGFEVGIDDETDAVVRSAVRLANSVVGAANLKPKLDLSGIASSVDGMAEGMAAEAQRPLVLAVNGRELGRVMASDNARAANNYNRSLALGVGKA